MRQLVGAGLDRSSYHADQDPGIPVRSAKFPTCRPYPSRCPGDGEGRVPGQDCGAAPRQLPEAFSPEHDLAPRRPDSGDRHADHSAGILDRARRAGWTTGPGATLQAISVLITPSRTCGGGRFDVVGWDIRGAGASRHVRCFRNERSRSRFFRNWSIPTTRRTSLGMVRKTARLSRR